MSDREPGIRADGNTPVDQQVLAEFCQQMIVALDGLWFMNVMKEFGAEKAMDIDIKSIIGQFKLTTRLWRKMCNLDGRSREDKAQVFLAAARLYGHEFEVRDDPGAVTMRLKKCAFYENIKQSGRENQHDCRMLCRKLAPAWFKEIEPRTGGEGEVDLQLPVGGSHCDWSVKQPEED